ncbi:peptidylprolyl isomerase [Lutimonas vermicola]|uniref:Peptidylprolyl isomerase n=1 Tax=Lutimonas vermicola TaxID=414288 RepID=A0ABU9KXL1_9FLAO
MMIKKVIILSAMFISGIVSGQDEEKVLFSIDGNDVYSSEFIRVFEKNKDIVVEDERKDFDDYFELFVDFKLKLMQARDIKLDTVSSYVSELSKYREQLVQPYLQNPEAIEVLVREAYDRTKEEVNASHILIRLEPDAAYADTLIAYQRITEARDKIVNGAGFDSIAKLYSEDPSVQMNNGGLGYFSAFSMVYAFENAAYTTKIGDISPPFRTQFGYHIVKVNDRRMSPGEVQVAHIMVKNDTTVLRNSKDKITDIYNKLEQGDDFATIAKDHSDDISSAQKGGVLPRFGTGRMIESFENVAFGLEQEGDFSEPFESDYGWHILKLLKKYPIGSYDELHAKLESKVKNGSRSSYVERSLAQKIAAQYKVVTYKAKLQEYPLLIDFKNNTDTLLSVEERIYSGDDFYTFAQTFQKRTKEDLYEEFTNKMIIDYFKDHLDETNKEFALTYKEYEDGLLLFELLQKKVWERSEKDSTGLVNYFEANRNNYVWKKRAELTIASCTRLEKAQLVRDMLLRNIPADSIKSTVNEGATIHVLFSKGKLEEGSAKLPQGYVFSMGVSDIFEEGKMDFTIIDVDTIFEPELKDLKETRGEVMNDYQNYLEKEWVKELHEAYQVKVNQRNYKELKKRLASQ